MMRTIAATDGVERELLERFRSRYDQLTAEERLALFGWMSRNLEVAREDVEEPLDRLNAAPADATDDWGRALRELRDRVASPRRRLLENLINMPGGLKFILELRAELLEAQRAAHEGLGPLEGDIADQLNSWCRHGFLYLEEIDRNSSFSKIHFLKEHELVHPMVGLDEMGHRLGQDRMCFALYHVVMPDEPVVFIEVALSKGLVRSIHDIIESVADERDPIKSPDTAVFYSINNTQNGLAGLGLGKVLIFRVTEALREHHPSLRTFATLSPIPGLWPGYLRRILQGDDAAFTLKRDALLDRIPPRSRETILARHRESGGRGDDLAAALVELLSRPDWIEDAALVRHLKKPLTEIAYTHVAEEADPNGKPLNPVAGFHLGNGARITRKNVNFAANTSPRGMIDSCGLMANYVYSQTTFQSLGSTVRSLLPWVRPSRP
jgi:hypothetical protein